MNEKKKYLLTYKSTETKTGYWVVEVESRDMAEMIGHTVERPSITWGSDRENRTYFDSALELDD